MSQERMSQSLQRLSARSLHPQGTLISVSGVTFGEKEIVLIAGPCAVESRQQILDIGQTLRSCGAHILKASLFKTRSAPYTFQGLGRQGLDILLEVKQQVGLPIATEVLAVEDIQVLAPVVDLVFVGARNIQNVALLRALGQIQKPVILKRGFGTTIDELLFAAEFVLDGGNSEVILCERGIRTFEPSTRFTLDIGAIPVLKERTHLPVIVDPSHAAGRREYVRALSLAAIAAGADGLMIEVHPDPTHALSDAAQQLSPDMFECLVGDLSRVASSVGRNPSPMLLGCY